MKFFALLFGLILISSTCFSAEASNPTELSWAGGLKVFLSKPFFSGSEDVSGDIELYNAEDYPLIGGQVVLHLAQGFFEYPSQLSENDNVVAEIVIKDIWILPKQSKRVSFSFGVQKPGAYRIDAYSWASKSKLIGASNIFFGPVSKSFSILGSGEYKRAVINRKLTAFNGAVGPIGFPIGAGEKISGEVSIFNDTPLKKTNLVLAVEVCEWALPFCSTKEKIFVNVPVIAPNESAIVKVNFAAPLIPSAYEINLVLSDGNSIESIYKNRVIVGGGTAKARKVFLHGFDSGNYSIGVVFAGSPDHFSRPVFEDFEVLAQVLKSKSLVEEKSVKINSIKTGEVMEEKFNFSSNVFDEFCVKVTKGSVVYDKQCYGIDLKLIEEEYNKVFPKKLGVEWDYDEAIGILSLVLKKEKINAQARIFSSDSTIYLEKISSSNVFAKKIPVPKDNLTLIVDDFDAKNQQVFSLNFGLPPENRDLPVPGELVREEKSSSLGNCTGFVCSNGFTCASQPKESANGPCCYSECVSSGVFSGTDGALSVPLIAWLALLFLIIALWVARSALKGVKKK